MTDKYYLITYVCENHGQPGITWIYNQAIHNSIVKFIVESIACPVIMNFVLLNAIEISKEDYEEFDGKIAETSVCLF